MNSYTLNLKPLANPITVEHFEQLCQLNPELKLETNDQGELIVIPPTGFETGRNNADLIAQFVIWNRRYQLGVVCDSSTGFVLANGAIRSPDISWIAKGRVDRFTKAEKARFLPLAPDFVLELMSPSDKLEVAQAKMTSDPAPSYGARERARMQEYQDNGVQLGWLINPQQQQVEIYSPREAKKVLEKPNTLSDREILPGLVVELDLIWF
ncbi:MAG: Uma2 family endonuclease [Cyanobacteria bacterium P01_G01_bin.39]